MKIKYLFLIAVPIGLYAQQGKYPDQWTLQNCIEYAKASNISINLQRLDQNISKQDLMQAEAEKYPDLSGNVSQGLFDVNYRKGVQAEGVPSQSLGLSSSMVLYHDNFIKNNVVAKNQQVQMAGLEVEESEKNITVSITQDFLSILMEQENIVALKSVLETTQTQLKQATQLLNAGSMSNLNFLQVQTLVSQDEFNVVQAQNHLRSDLVNLKELLQLPSSYDFQISAPPEVTVSSDLKSLQDVQNIAQDQRPEIKYGKLNEENAEVNLDMAKAATKPTLSLTGSFGTSYSKGLGAYFPQLKDNLFLPVGLSLSIPILNNRVNKTNVEIAKIQTDEAKLDLDNARTVLNQQVEQAYISLQNSLSQYYAAKKQMDLNQKSLDIVNSEMKFGAIDYVQLQQQKQQFTQALENYLQAKYSAVLSKQIYDFYDGQPIVLK